MVVVGRAKAWTEKDFSYDITGGVDFMGNVSAQVAEYKDTLDQKTLLSILKGVFAMPTTDAKNKEFVENHSTTIYAPMSATTLNSAVNKACGANKQKFSLVFMHSDVATNLENMKLLEFMKQTGGDGIQKDLTLATWNGRTVVVDDDLPAVTGYADAEADTPGALVIKASGASGASEIDLAKATPYFGTRTLAADMYVVQMCIRDRNWREELFNPAEISAKDGVKSAFGLDFGYTNDPTALFCGLVSTAEKTIWVFDELYKKALTNRAICEQVTVMGYAKERIKADCAEPKSIDELREAGLQRIRAARKGKDSVNTVSYTHLSGMVLSWTLPRKL